jgi:hypothetical protein
MKPTYIIYAYLEGEPAFELMKQHEEESEYEM